MTADARRRRLRNCCAALALLLAAPPALAWNGAGHRLVAVTAWRGLDAATRAAVGRLLLQHPDAATWVARSPELPPAYAAFVEAATWPDDIRHDPRFHDEGEAPTPALPGFPDMARHRDWHYADRAVAGIPAPEPGGTGQIDSRIPALERTVADRGQTIAARAYALVWLLHLVGDAHQPLHAASRYDAAGQSDRGGNGVAVNDLANARRPRTTLHAYWDDLPGPAGLRGAALEAAADRLPAPATPATPAGVVTWLGESERLAREVAYAGIGDEAATLDAAYRERATRVADERLRLAGQRLALELRQLFANPD